MKERESKERGEANPKPSPSVAERLRALSRCEHDDLSIGAEAADELDRLTALVKEAEEIVGPFAQIAADYDRGTKGKPDTYRVSVALGECRAARAFLSKPGPQRFSF